MASTRYSPATSSSEASSGAIAGGRLMLGKGLRGKRVFASAPEERDIKDGVDAIRGI